MIWTQPQQKILFYFFIYARQKASFWHIKIGTRVAAATKSPFSRSTRSILIFHQLISLATIYTRKLKFNFHLDFLIYFFYFVLFIFMHRHKLLQPAQLLHTPRTPSLGERRPTEGEEKKNCDDDDKEILRFFSSSASSCDEKMKIFSWAWTVWGQPRPAVEDSIKHNKW